MSPIIKNMIGQRKPKFSLEKVREQNQIFISDLSGIGRQEAILTANLILAKWHLICGNVPEKERTESDVFCG